jgi:hypothetical protein
MKKIFVILTVLSSLASSQTIGSGLTFLKLGVGARSVAMGEAFTAVSGDLSASYYNPAAQATADRYEVSVMHKQWIEGTSSEYLGATILGNGYNVGFTALTTSVGGIEVRTQPGPAEATFAAKNFALGGTVSAKLSNELAVGISGKMLYEKIFVDEASGYGIDFGGQYFLDNNITIGASMLNLGSMSKLKNDKSVLPATFRAGVSYTSPLTDQFDLLAAADGAKTFNDQKIHLNAGAEVVYDKQIALRAGYQTGFYIKYFSAGIGIHYGIIKVDYAFVPMTQAFGSTHTFSLSFLL